MKNKTTKDCCDFISSIFNLCSFRPPDVRSGNFSLVLGIFCTERKNSMLYHFFGILTDEIKLTLNMVFIDETMVVWQNRSYMFETTIISETIIVGFGININAKITTVKTFCYDMRRKWKAAVFIIINIWESI